MRPEALKSATQNEGAKGLRSLGPGPTTDPWSVRANTRRNSHRAPQRKTARRHEGAVPVTIVIKPTEQASRRS